MSKPSTPAPSRPNSPPPCPPPPPPSPVGRTTHTPQQPGEEILDAGIPTVPARTYTPVLPAVILAQPRGQLVGMLKAFARALGWVGAGSAVGVVVYVRWILPLLNETLERRTALLTHTMALASRISSLLTSLRSHTSHSSAPASTAPTSPEASILSTPTLSTSSPPSAPMHPLSSLPSALSALSTTQHRLQSQRALQALSVLTSYVSERTYGPSAAWNQEQQQEGDGGFGAEVESARREVRAIRGLLLNRRSFATPTLTGQ